LNQPWIPPQPAGHLEANESLIQACEREVFEETGLQLKINKVETDPQVKINKVVETGLLVKINKVEIDLLVKIKALVKIQETDLLVKELVNQTKIITTEDREIITITTDRDILIAKSLVR
jgi:hypothetical protein